jgi:hypothetical protein
MEEKTECFGEEFQSIISHVFCGSCIGAIFSIPLSVISYQLMYPSTANNSGEGNIVGFIITPLKI